MADTGQWPQTNDGLQFLRTQDLLLAALFTRLLVDSGAGGGDPCCPRPRVFSPSNPRQLVLCLC